MSSGSVKGQESVQWAVCIPGHYKGKRLIHSHQGSKLLDHLVESLVKMSGHIGSGFIQDRFRPV